MQADYDHAMSIAEMDFPECEEHLLKIISSNDQTEESSKIREQSIYSLAELYSKKRLPNKIVSLLESVRPFFAIIPKAKTAKIVRTLIDFVGNVPGANDLEIKLCLEWIDWTKVEKRTFLRQRLESKLSSLYLKTKNFRQSLEIINRLLREVKKMDDKAMLVEIHLLESSCHYALKNLPKARAALTAARTSANSIYVPPYQQAEIDILSGTLHAEEHDYKTAYSYFYEAFENYGSLNRDDKAVQSLKYMLMCKVMTDNADDINQIITGKAGIRYTGREVDAMKAIAAAYTARSLANYEVALQQYPTELKDDIVVNSHLAGLYETLLEQNLARILEPFSRVQIDHVAKLMKLERPHVEQKLSQMILDKKLNGILDQGTGCLILNTDDSINNIYDSTTGTLENMGGVVESLFKKTLKLS
eukprot:c20392_g1_i1.p2 GENE.c20392_g1_i1~~c20392_g1_i1.p2  ORF type:complete len:440 (+),score=173.19 c20392_g1_i1:71-1321(+)